MLWFVRAKVMVRFRVVLVVELRLESVRVPISASSRVSAHAFCHSIVSRVWLVFHFFNCLLYILIVLCNCFIF